MKLVTYTCGQTKILDIRSKGTYVLQMVLGKRTAKQIAQETGYSPGTVRTWAKKYGDRVEEMLDCPPGVPYLVAKDRLEYTRTERPTQKSSLVAQLIEKTRGA